MLRKLLGKILGSSKKSEPSTSSHGGSARSRKPGPQGKSTGTAAGHHAKSPRGDRPRHGDKADKRESRPESREGHRTGESHGPAKPHGRQGHGHPNTSAHGHARPDDGSTGGDKRRRRRRGGRGRNRDRDREHGSGSGSERRRDRPAHEESASDARAVAEQDSSLETVNLATQTADETPAAPIEVPAITPDSEFSDLGLEPFVVAAVEAKGYQQPTPIQSEAIPIVLSGRDVIGSAQTGTGKTAAFALPMLQQLGTHGKLRCLILEPTRELALQVEEALRDYGKFTNLRHTVIFGGVGYGPQRDAIKRGLDIVVATPGRLLDHISQGDLSLKGINYLVLDEVDRMLDMGFLPDVKRIIEMCPKERQTLFFSATIPPELEKLTQWCLRDPHTIEIGRRRAAAETVSHAFYPVIESQKFALLQELLERTHYDSVLIFCRTKHGADFVASRLKVTGHKVAVMHSNRSQAERMEALKGFKSGKYEVLVATDLAARGLDIAGVTHVINFDTPQHAEDYVHRIGRTGRAQTEGDAFTLLTEDEMKHAFAIERFIGQKVERKKLEGFPYQYSAIFESAADAPKNVFRSRLYRGTRK
jgi:ATP-dependent RNA helicase RhlE